MCHRVPGIHVQSILEELALDPLRLLIVLHEFLEGLQTLLSDVVVLLLSLVAIEGRSDGPCSRLLESRGQEVPRINNVIEGVLQLIILSLLLNWNLLLSKLLAKILGRLLSLDMCSLRSHLRNSLGLLRLTDRWCRLPEYDWCNLPSISLRR